MAILTAADKPIYFPSVLLTGAELDGAIAATQNLIEAHLNRPLEIRQYHEVRKLHQSMSFCRLSYLPIWKMPAPTIEGRFTGGLNRNFRRVPATDWVLIRSADYELERSGRLQLRQGAGARLTSWVPGFAINEIRATYQAGVNFAVDSAEVKRLKSAAAAILTYSLSDLFKGITERSVDKEYSVRYGANSGSGLLPGTVPESYFAPFQRYKPGHYQPWDFIEPITPLDPMHESAEIDVSCSAGQVVFIKTSGHLDLARADSILTTRAAGLLTENAIASTSAIYSPDGVIELPDWTAATESTLLSPGQSYFLSPDVPGMLTMTAPTAVGQFVVYLGTALTPNRFSVEISPAIAL
jgi:hypothetical protein